MAYVEKYVSSLAGGGGDGSSGSPWTLAECVANLAAGERGNCKDDGTYAQPAAFTNSGTRTSPIALRGYTTTIGDGGRATIGSMIAWNHGGGFTHFEDMEFTGNTTVNLVRTQVNSVYSKCTFNNAGSGGGFQTSLEATLVDCFIKSGSGAPIAGGMPCLVRCRVEGAGTSTLVGATNYLSSAIGCVFVGDGTGSGVTLNDSIADYMQVVIDGCSFYNLDDGIDMSGMSENNWHVVIANNIFDTIAGDAIAGAAAFDGGVVIYNNAFYSITGSNLSGNDKAESVSEIALTGSPFTDASGGDFSLNNTASAGAACRDAAFEAPTA